ncbi:MAG: ABC transporter permease [Parasphingopyxis sp.]|uniref:ABC transporter permease n=1 Tax=Parasphingopyxis sp. TaxID=1920299 RepID=UPI003F9ECDA0
MGWIALRMLTGDRVKLIGLLFGVAFSTLLISQQLTIFVNLIMRGAVAVQEVSTADVWVMDPSSRTVDVFAPMPSTALERVRGVDGVAYASPMLRSSAVVRTPSGDLEGVNIVGVDDSTLIGLPRRMAEGDRRALAEPDSVFIDDTGSRKLFGPDEQVVGTRLELNDQRAVIRGIADAVPTFTSQVILYTRYSNALRYAPGTRNRMSFVLVRSDADHTPDELVAEIEAETGLKARTAEDFANDGLWFIIENTGIPVNFGITVVLGFIVGVAIVGLTFTLFIRDNIKQFGALKAIGVTNANIRSMVAIQAGFVGLVGYGIGIFVAEMFFVLNSGVDTFKGFYMPWQIPLLTAVVTLVMIMLTGFLALRSVLKTEPAEVFR